jgi:cell division protein FtsB
MVMTTGQGRISGSGCGPLGIVLVGVVVDPTELLVESLAILVLLGLAGGFAWQQLRLRRRLGQPGTPLPPAEQAHLRAQVRRRLLGSGMLVLLAGLLAGSFFLEGRLQQVHRERQEQTAHGVPAPVRAEHRLFLGQFTLYWLTALLVLFGLLLVVLADLRATVRFSQQQRRQLNQEWQQTLAQELARWRRQGNGQSH